MDAGSRRILALIPGRSHDPAMPPATPFSSSAPVRHPTLERTLMVGYQGWFRVPNDRSGMQWDHYQTRTNQFQPGTDTQPEFLNIDYWPAVDELPATVRQATPFSLADGATAEVFTSFHSDTIDLHFEWMRQHGIDGAFVQRFAVELLDPKTVAQIDQVLAWELAAAEKAGCSVAVMYDLSGFPHATLEAVLADWQRLTTDPKLKLTQSPAYQHHRGRPLVGVWGVGFDDGRAYSLAEIGRLLNSLRDVAGGCSLLAGVASGWRTARDWRSAQTDATNDTALPGLLARVDVISPWTPGRFEDLGQARIFAETNWRPDLAWCKARGVDYLPVVFPGFS